MLISLEVSDENQSVVVFNFLHGRLGCQRMLNDVVGIHAVTGRSGLPGVLGVSDGSEGPWPAEMHGGAVLLYTSSMGTFHDPLLDFLGLLNGFSGGLFVVGGCDLLYGLFGHGLLALGVALCGCKIKVHC